MELRGFLNIDKPIDWTSHDVVARLRRLLGIKKIGHAGTLDPFATGCLPVALGPYTRLMQYLRKSKRYIAEIDFSGMTDTDDHTGEKFADIEPIVWEQQAFEEELASFIGKQDQIPPAYSARKLNGKRLYELMRSGEGVDLEAVKTKQITIHEIILHEFNYPHAKIEISCSEGTYIRSIARDLGGHLTSLRRTESNSFTLDSAVSLEFVAEHADRIEEFLLDFSESLALPALPVERKEAIDLQLGKRVNYDLGELIADPDQAKGLKFNQLKKDVYVQCLDDEELIGLACIVKKKEAELVLQPKVIF